MYLVVNIVLLLSTPIFCAQNNSRSYIESNGMPTFGFADWGYNDLHNMHQLCTLIAHNKANVQAKKVYAQDLIRVTPALQTVVHLMISIVDDNPECVDQMLYAFISKEEEPVIFSWLAGWAGQTYVSHQRYDDAVRLLTASLRAALNAPSMKHMAAVNLDQKHFQAAAYWMARYRDRKFQKDAFAPGALERLYEMIKVEEDQLIKENKQKKLEYDFEKNMPIILQYETDGMYN